jgi:hypothetical protein
MTRPPSHRDQPHERCCGNCRFAYLIAYKLDLLCFHSDDIHVLGNSQYPVASVYLNLKGDAVSLMEGDEYDKVWAGRIVDQHEVCDEWTKEE